MEPHNYNVVINWNQDRRGVMCSPELNKDSNKCIEIATPPEFPKGIPGIWSPEHLFTASVSSCLMTTFLAIAENFKLEFVDFSCSAKGTLEQVDSLADQIGIAYLHAPPDENGDYLVDHTSSIFLLDPDARLTAIFSAPHAVETIQSRFIQIENFIRAQD